jgi:hypothetical protein
VVAAVDDMASIGGTEADLALAVVKCGLVVCGVVLSFWLLNSSTNAVDVDAGCLDLCAPDIL